MTVTSPLDLRSLTLDEALAALAAGVSLQRLHGEPFVLTEEGRSALQFYAARRHYWDGKGRNMSMAEAEELLAWMAQTHAPPPAPSPVAGAAHRVLELVRVEIHQWGGLHAHCLADGRAPEPLTLELDGGMVVVRGRNGSGKTSLANTIRWALTGQVASAQGGPRHEPARTAPRFEDESSGGPGFPLPTISPLPTGDDLSALGGSPTVETRVSLTFRYPDGGERVFERKVVPEGRTRFSTRTVPADGPELALGVSSRAIEVSALLLARLPHLDLDRRNPLAESVATLTGLQPLEELGRRSKLTTNYLRKQAMERIRKEQSAFSSQLREEKIRILQLADNHRSLGLPPLPTEPRDAQTAEHCRRELSDVQARLEAHRERHGRMLVELAGLDAAVLKGSDMDALCAQVSRAKAMLSGSHLRKLAPLILMETISKISDEDAVMAESTCVAIAETAESLRIQEASREAAARRRLYAQVMHWHREVHPQVALPTSCPVCATVLDGVANDAILGIPVQDALNEAVSARVEARMSAATWARDTEQRLLSMLPDSLQSLMTRSPPSSPQAAYRTALSEDLLADQAFAGSLQPLVARARVRWATIETRLPPFVAPTSPAPPPSLAPVAGSLFAKLGRVSHILGMRSWRQRHAEEVQRAMFGMLRPASSDDLEGLSIPEELEALHDALVALRPVANGIELIERADRALDGWQAGQSRIEAAEQCAKAVSEFAGIADLVHEQVGDLMRSLNDRTHYWLDLAYRHPTDNRPTLSHFERDAGATLRTVASYHGVRGPADGITNASAQRAYLWAFSIALWEKLRDSGSTLSLLILDDPQTLFDTDNAKKLAGAITKLAAGGAQPFLVSSHHDLCKHVHEIALAEDVVLHNLELIPRSHGQAMADLRISVEGMKRGQRRWNEAKDDDDRIRAFLGGVREYLEGELRWLLDHGLAKVPRKPTLQTLLDEVRRLGKARVAPYDSKPFSQLLGHPPLQPRSEFRDAIDEAHHGAGRQLTTADARVVDAALDGVLKVVSNCRKAVQRP